ncbi:MAG: carbohydrate ABC transporter permease [Micromonosporaceae bacterium]
MRYRKSLAGVLILLVYLFPIYWMVSTSLKTSGNVFSAPPDLIPSPATLASYTDAALAEPAVLRGLWNSAVISVGTLLLTLIIGVPAAYGLARLRLRFTLLVSLTFLVAQMLPSINVALPIFVIFSRFGLVDSYLGLILANTAFSLSFTVIVLRPYFFSVPESLVDAARVDGCGRLGAFLRVVLPLARPGLIAAAALSFVGTWGEFVFGLTLTTSEQMQPVTVVLNKFIGQYETRWNDLMAVATIAALPVIVLFIALQRFVVSGLTSGATKD